MTCRRERHILRSVTMSPADPRAPAPPPRARRWARARVVRAVARVAWMDVVAFLGASAAMLPILRRRRPLGRELQPGDAVVPTPPTDRRASQA